MSFDPTANYLYSLLLRDRTQTTPTTVTEGNVISGDLLPYHLKSELTNVAHSTLVDNMRITFRIDPDGTFIRAAPLLTDEDTKTKYVIDAQITQDGELGKLFRMEISQAMIQEDENYGEVLVITGRGQEYWGNELLSARPLFFRNPDGAFNDRITDFNINSHGDNPKIGTTIVNLPDQDSLKQNWIPTGPVTVNSLFKQILDRLALPASSGGVLTDFYWDTDPRTDQTKFFDVDVREFGSLPIADGDRVEINPEEFTSAEQKDKNLVTDSEVFKNQVILRGGQNKGSLPMDYTRFSSNFEHARRRPEWVSLTSYKNNNQDGTSLVKRTLSPVGGCTNCPDILMFFKSRTDHSSATAPENDPTNWLQDFTIYPPFKGNGAYLKGNIVSFDTGPNIQYFQVLADESADNAFEFGVNGVDDPDLNANFTSFGDTFQPADFTDFVPFSPWTADADLWIANMTENRPTGFRGGFVDWNFVRANYDPLSRPDFTNEFSHITMKWVTRVSNSPPTGDELFSGQRILVGTAGTGLFSGQDNKVAQLADTSTDWRFSKAPEQNDTLVDLSTMQVKRWDAGAWVVGFDPETDFGNKASVMHFVEEVHYVPSPGADGTANQAVEFVFNWDTVIGDEKNLNSRGAWINFWYPFPRLALTPSGSPSVPSRTLTIGEAYGSNLEQGTFDADNLQFNAKGLLGWNRGLDTEDLGRVGGLAMKLRHAQFDSNGNAMNRGVANIPYTFFAVDKFDRVFFHDFTLKRNGGWEPVVIPFGLRARKNIYNNRLDELLPIMGWNPLGNFFLDERQLTGVTFDWRFVKMWGIQSKGSYDDAGMYKGSLGEAVIDLLTSIAQYIVSNTQEITSDEFLRVDTGTVRLGISDLRYIKELYINSEDEQIDNGRTIIMNKESEIDYNSGKLACQGRRERLKFFPQRMIAKSFGDVRMRAGHRFLVTGDKVPGGSQELVVQSVKHVIDASSYKMEVEAIRKFVLP